MGEPAETLGTDVGQAAHGYYGSEVKLINPAIGGTTLSQNVILTPRWLQETPAPDLVTIWFGGNDWDTGVADRGTSSICAWRSSRCDD